MYSDANRCLYSTLANGPIRRGCIPFYILCNKQDIITATGAESIRVTLEREMYEKVAYYICLMPVYMFVGLHKSPEWYIYLHIHIHMCRDNLRKTRAVSSHLGEEEVSYNKVINNMCAFGAYKCRAMCLENYLCIQVFLGTPGTPFAFSQLPHRIAFEPGAIENIESVAVWTRDIVNIDNHNTLPNWLRPLSE